MPCAIFKLSLWHNTRLSKMLITIFRLWITDELTHRTLAQAAFRSNVDYPLVCYLLTDGLVRTVRREFCCRNETIRRHPWVRHYIDVTILLQGLNLWRHFQETYQTRETVFHRDIQTLRRELKIRRAAVYSRGVWIADETLSRVFDISS